MTMSRARPSLSFSLSRHRSRSIAAPANASIEHIPRSRNPVKQERGDLESE
jgi:hypothetical protein